MDGVGLGGGDEDVRLHDFYSAFFPDTNVL